MALFVQIGEPEEHHRLDSFTDLDVVKDDAMQSTRQYITGCGQAFEGPAHRMSEADVEPGGARCGLEGCFPKGKKA
jgi:hypothetical protein